MYLTQQCSTWLLGVEDFDTNAKASTPSHNPDDEGVAQLHQYLTTMRLPPDLEDDAQTRLLQDAKQFFLANGRLWRQHHQGHHQLYIAPPQRDALLRDAHDNLGHKGFYSTCCILADRFWWPALKQDVKCYVNTCHQCQLRKTTKVCILPVVATPAPLFHKAYVDTMLMPHTHSCQYIVQARCSLTAWPEWCVLRVENRHTIGAFLFEEVLCRWGAVEEIVTDNSTPYVAALDWLAERYGIHHICISAYNLQANGIIERQHHTIQESLMKACDSNPTRWPTIAPLVFCADHATIQKVMGYSPFYMAHGIEPILPLDITLATFLLSNLT